MRKRVALAAVFALAALGYGVVPPGQADGGRSGGPSDSGMTLGHVPRAVATTTATVLIGPNGHLVGFDTPEVSISQGASLRVVNHENLTHTFTSVAVDAEGNPLFDVVIPPNSTRRVPAVSLLQPGTYRFSCRIHPNMRGTLTVLGKPSGQPQPTLKFELPLVIPKVVDDDHVVLRAQQTMERVLPHGPKTPMWTYDGSYPGPTIMRRAGEDTKVTVINRLPLRGGQLTLHFHGDHHESKHDGQPDSQLIPRYDRKTYDFPLTEEGRPERAAFEFYHDHRMDRTGRNVWKGLEGLFIVKAPRERRLDLPGGEYDVPLLVADRSFDADNRLTGGFTATMMATGPLAPPNDAHVGTKILVNGRFAPYLDVAAHRYRLRILNGSNFSVYDFALSDGRPFTQIGTGNGLLPHPVQRQDILIGPAQRVDVVVDFRGELGKQIVLKSIARTDAAPSGIGSREARIMQFRVTHRAPDTSRVPFDLSRIPQIKVPTKVAKRWVFALSGDEQSGTFWSVNGKPFDPARIDHRVKLGTTELWELHNAAPITHFIHLHEERWHTISRDGHRPPPWERGLEDTWRLDPGETVRVAAKFTDYTGKFMLHCHMLDHEDHGMMAQFSVLRHLDRQPRPVAFHPAPDMTGMDMSGMDMTGMDMTMPGSDRSDPGIAVGASVLRVLSRSGQALAVELVLLAAVAVVRRPRLLVTST